MAAAVSGVTGDFRLLWTVATGSGHLPFDILGLFEPPGADLLVFPLAAVACAFRAWLIWQIFRGAAVAGGDKRTDGPRAGWLSLLLYLSVADALFLSDLVDLVAQDWKPVVGPAIWTATAILFVRALTGESRRFRALGYGLVFLDSACVVLVFLGLPMFGYAWSSLLRAAGFGWTASGGRC
ncbi:hypothetical protein [Spongiactinospora gelatinilytica]|uniref:hypothetical protein n=1 Tax=Spongiactinospora gelatinilytica TaxID=2666298 RepID=UPI0011B944A7|nr:hypothetical protein [Spongiactinospora gelatinilytica]